MKIENALIAAIVMLLSVGLLAQEDKPDPERLAKAREIYVRGIAKIDEERNRRLKDFTARYIRELEKIQTAYTKKGDLDAALAVRKEIDGLKPVLNPSKNWKEAPTKTETKKLEAELKAKEAEKEAILREASLKKIKSKYDDLRKDMGKTRSLSNKYKEWEKYVRQFNRYADENDVKTQVMLVEQALNLYNEGLVTNPLRVKMAHDAIDNNLLPALAKSKMPHNDKLDIIRTLGLPAGSRAKYLKEVK